MSKKLILVVDDEQDIREAIACILETTDRYETIKASDGQEAYEMFKDKNPDLVITDFHMSQTDGAWLINKIRESDVTKPIILMSSMVSKDSEELSSKYQLFIQKPEDINNIVSAVDDFLLLDII